MMQVILMILTNLPAIIKAINELIKLLPHKDGDQIAQSLAAVCKADRCKKP